ncbi:proline-, glutamic acid- and leucine-rich protein 1 isoform X2 [Drosophila montana]|uniref:proline-, glutamic acid- and leucine-rich protein 1 isoform X2 n=1 Tax=Drosophila montana TaxID=40370 RepID=UPI00313AA294
MFRAGDMLNTFAQEDQNVNPNVLDQNYNGASAASQAQSITLLLLKTKTRSIGLRFLIKYLNQFPNIFHDKANVWLTIIIRTCNSKEISLYGHLIFEALALLVIQIQVSPEIVKWFGSTCIGKIYESLWLLEKNTTTCCKISALKALKQCLKYYPGPSKSGKLLVLRYLLTLVDCCNPEVVYESGNCWLLLQQVRGNFNNVGCNTDKSQWEDLQIGLLGSINDLLNEVFPNYKDENIAIKYRLECFTLVLEGDPIKKAAQVCRRFCNLIDFLKIALSEPYSSTKLIYPRKILNLVQHGLGSSYANCVNYENMDGMCFGNLVPQMHTKLFELLEVLINICHTHLRMHFRLISSILLESLRKTKWSTPEGFPIQLINLRIQVYKVTSSWLSTFAEGSGCDLIAEYFVKDLLEDVIIRRTDIYVLSIAQQKNISKRKCKKNNHTILEPYFQSGSITNKNKGALCKQALQCIQKVLEAVGFLLKPQLLKVMLTNLLETSVQIFQNSMRIQNPYNEWDCRLELYKTLLHFFKLRNIPCYLPTDIILYVLQESLKKDPSSDLRLSYKSLIASVEITVHPQRENINLKVDTQNSRQQNSKYIYENPKNTQKIQQKKEETTDNMRGENENTTNNAAINDILPTTHEDGKKLEVCSIIFADHSDQYSKADWIANDVKINKCHDDDDFIAELKKAFVDEFK